MSFTRDTALSALILIFVGCGLYLMARSIWPRKQSTESRRFRITSLLGGAVLLAILVVLRPTVVFESLTGRIQDAEGLFALAVLLGSLIIGVALGDYVFARLVPAIASLVGRDSELAKIVTALLSGFVLVLIAWMAVDIVDPTVEARVGGSTALSVELVAEFTLPDEPRDLVFRGPSSGYISFPEQIAYFEVVGSGENRELILEEAVGPDGIDNPRGMTLGEGYLFVAEQGQSEEDAPDGVFSTNGQVVRFGVAPDGRLSGRTVVVGDVPVMGTLHGINGLALGPDSMIYVSIGGTRDQLVPEPPNAEWLGSILRFDSNGNNVEVYASGLRNVYDLEFDDQGHLWGVDNDGPTNRGYRAEEVLQIKENHFYGYPEEGTYGPYLARTDGPIWAYMGTDVEGSAGIELAQNVGLDAGVLVGARTLTYARISEDVQGFYASTDYDFQGAQVVFTRQGYFTIVEADSSGILYVGVVGLSLQSNLYLLDLND